MDELVEDLARWIAKTFYQMECELGQKINEIYGKEELK